VSSLSPDPDARARFRGGLGGLPRRSGRLGPLPGPIWALPPWPALDSMRRGLLCPVSGSPRPEFSGIARVYVAPAPDLRLRVRSQLCMA
jgi:hypothetical protein